MKGRDIMAVSTATDALRREITTWRDSLLGVASNQAVGDVQSLLQDVCIGARVGTSALPRSLQVLHDDIVERSHRQARGGYPSPFGAGDLLRTLNEALGQL